MAFALNKKKAYSVNVDTLCRLHRNDFTLTDDHPNYQQAGTEVLNKTVTVIKPGTYHNFTGIVQQYYKTDDTYSVNIDVIEHIKGINLRRLQKNKVVLLRADTPRTGLIENFISDEWGNVTPISKYFDGIGNVLILNEEWWPSLPSDYGSAVIIGQNTKGELVQISPEIPLQEPAQNLNIKSFVKSKNGYEKSITCDTCIKMIETRYSTSYGGIRHGLFFPLDINGDFKKQEIQIKSSPIYSIDSEVNKLDSGNFECYMYSGLNTDSDPIIVMVNMLFSSIFINSS